MMATAVDRRADRGKRWWLLALALGLSVGACSDAAAPVGGGGVSRGGLDCSIPQSQILPGGPGKDGIPALTDPDMVPADSSAAGYLADDARVIGLVVEGQAYAVPLNIMWWHEIVNFNLAGRNLAVTHCPLTGSSLAFDRSVVDGAEFGVSGLLYLNNLIMYDRRSGESLWPQMERGARCGPGDGTTLPMYPVVEMRWLRWRRLHPDTRVVSTRTGHLRDYDLYPYGDYDELNNPETLFPLPDMDDRRPPKERVLGIPAELPGVRSGEGGVAYPFGVLEGVGPLLAVHDVVGGAEIVVFWNQGGRGAMAYYPTVDGQPLAFEVVDGRILDRQTGSEWTEDGRAVDGTLAGTRLLPVAEAYVAYWFAWAAFHPETEIWGGGSS